MDDLRLWSNLSALAALAGVVAYALFGGADFGGGVWDLLASGERKKQQADYAAGNGTGLGAQPFWLFSSWWCCLLLPGVFGR